MKDQPSMTKKKFLYNLSRTSYQKNWGKDYQQPTFGEKFLAFLARILPKMGPLKSLQLRAPTPETERMFEASFNATLDRYRQLLSQVGTGQPELPNVNFDTGEITGPGKYRLNDELHAKFLDALAKQNFRSNYPLTSRSRMRRAIQCSSLSSSVRGEALSIPHTTPAAKPARARDISNKLTHGRSASTDFM
jgi:hypothetical protein